MAQLTIPAKFRGGLAAFGALPEDVFLPLFEFLKSAGSADSPETLAARFVEHADSVSNRSTVKMITALTSMQQVWKRSHVEPDEFARDIWDALSEDASDLVADVDADTLKRRMARFVAETDIQLTSLKISELRNEVERVFCSARVLTDIRASFSDDASEPPDAVTILHTLEITFHDDAARHREFYVALDDEDLASLKKTIERAELKKKTLTALLQKTDFRLFD